MLKIKMMLHRKFKNSNNKLKYFGANTTKSKPIFCTNLFLQLPETWSHSAVWKSILGQHIQFRYNTVPFPQNFQSVKYWNTETLKYSNIQIVKNLNVHKITIYRDFCEHFEYVQNIYSKILPDLPIHPWDPEHSPGRNVQQSWKLLCRSWPSWSWEHTGD